MIETLYEPFRHWSAKGSVYLLSDTHFDDEDCRLIDPDWISPEEQLNIINRIVTKNDTFIHLGDVGRPEYTAKIRAGHKVLLCGNHDRRKDHLPYFDEIYTGPLFISDRILLSHEPVYGLNWCLNIHGHDHLNNETVRNGCRYLNLAANLCNYTPVSLSVLIRSGILADIEDIHRQAIDKAIDRKKP